MWVITPLKPDGGREWPYYSGKKHRIIIEEYIESNPDPGGLTEYKFFCFNGTPEFLYLITDRTLGNGAGVGIYDSSFRKKEVVRPDERVLNRTIKKPDFFEQMKDMSTILSSDFPEVRVDFFNNNVDNRIVFSELTFFDGSGYMTFEPDSFDYEAGSYFLLPEKAL